MLDFLEDIEDYDALFFLPDSEDDEGIQIKSSKYKTPGLPVSATENGSMWHILLFKCNEESGNVDNLDHFDAVLSDPREYISGLIPSGWFGLVAKKTTTSDIFMSDALDKYNSMM